MVFFFHMADESAIANNFNYLFQDKVHGLLKRARGGGLSGSGPALPSSRFSKVAAPSVGLQSPALGVAVDGTLAALQSRQEQFLAVMQPSTELYARDLEVKARQAEVLPSLFSFCLFICLFIYFFIFLFFYLFFS